METNTMRLSAAYLPISGQLVLPCATPAADLRTLSVRSNVRFGTAQGAAVQDTAAKRVRWTAPTTGMGQVGFADTVPGSQTWSPPI